jgi:hypothetical protein
MTPHSGGSVPRRVGKKEKKPERQSAAEVNRKLTEALKRLGEPTREYRQTRDRIVRKKNKKK